ncbi:MAG: heavy-metal-associated domain-containing protein [Candidatus Heimdallarchaeota archaeon]|nr:heavy-metal-associated domain-containing protein [Candidatus Heimdallarchaeota archaeon]
MTKLELKIEGMTCGSCSRAITARSSKFDFVDASTVKVDHDAGTGEMEISGDFEVNSRKVIDIINKMGYKVVE